MIGNMEYLRKLLHGPEPPDVYPDLVPPDPPGPSRPSRCSRHVRTVGRRGGRPGCFSGPGGVAVTREGVIVVADTENHRVQLFSVTGELRSVIGERGSRPHHLHHPVSVALTPDSAQNIALTDSVNACIKIFRQDGSFVAQYTECGEFPHGLAITSDYYMVTSDLSKHCLVVLHPTGHKQREIGQGILNHPYYITCDPQDNLVVSDSGNSSVKRFRLDGTLLQDFSVADFRLASDDFALGFGCQPFVMLQGLCVDTLGNLLLIAESTVYICAANGRLWEVLLAEDGLHSPKCLACCPGGRVVITQCGYDNRHEITICDYNPEDFASLQRGPLSYGNKTTRLKHHAATANDSNSNSNSNDANARRADVPSDRSGPLSYGNKSTRQKYHAVTANDSNSNSNSNDANARRADVPSDRSRSRSRSVSVANSGEESSPTSALCSSITMSYSGMSCSDS